MSGAYGTAPASLADHRSVGWPLGRSTIRESYSAPFMGWPRSQTARPEKATNRVRGSPSAGTGCAAAKVSPSRISGACDREYLIAELSRAVGLGGRARKAGDTGERARTSVTRSIRYALARIEEHHPALADHLRQAVRTGAYCTYTPDPRVPVDWTV